MKKSAAAELFNEKNIFLIDFDLNNCDITSLLNAFAINNSIRQFVE